MGATRKCTKCNKVRERWEFGADKRNASGLKSHCRSCCSKWAKRHYRTVVKPRRGDK